MTQRAVRSIRAFEPRGDFSPPRADAPADTVAVSAAELAALLDDARQSAREQVERTYTEAADRVQDTADQLARALDDILTLAEQLDRVKLQTEDRKRALALMRTACQHIVDGQQDLFNDLAASTDR